MARVLGARFLDRRGRKLPEGCAALATLDKIVLDGMDPRLRRVCIEAACDVTNPLAGPKG